MEARAVTVHWSTDKGRVYSRVIVEADRPLREAVQRVAEYVEARGYHVLKVVRVYHQCMPLVGGTPCPVMAGPRMRAPESLFPVRHTLPWEEGDGSPDDGGTPDAAAEPVRHPGAAGVPDPG